MLYFSIIMVARKCEQIARSKNFTILWRKDNAGKSCHHWRTVPPDHGMQGQRYDRLPMVHGTQHQAWSVLENYQFLVILSISELKQDIQIPYMWKPAYHNGWQCGGIPSVWESISLPDVVFIQPPIATALKFGFFFGRDGWFPAIFIDIVDQIPTVIIPVRQHAASVYIYMLQYRDCKIDVITLSFTKHQTDRTAISIYGCMDFGTGSPAAVSDFVWRPLFLPRCCAGGPWRRLKKWDKKIQILDSADYRGGSISDVGFTCSGRKQTCYYSPWC